MTPFASFAHRRKHAAATQRGIVLLLVLIILVVLSGAAIWAAKASISGEQIANNIRISATVNELAELALRYCEDGVIKNNNAIVRLAFPTNTASGQMPSAWQTLSNWTATPSQINTVPAAQLQDALGRSPAKAPVCMVEEMRLAPIDMQRLQGYLITARGFSQDYVEAANGTITSGTDAWVQSMIRF
jgi:type IV pilus assembly protein PilX